MKTKMLLPLSITLFSLLIGCGKNTEPDKKYYTVEFDTSEGSYIAPIKVLEGDKISKPENPTREGYTFNNWNINEDGIKVYNFDSPVTKDLVLVASWNIIPPIPSYTINFDSKGGTFVPHQEVLENKKVTKPNNPVKRNFIFEYWYIEEPGAEIKEYNFDTPVTKNITLAAKWSDTVTDVSIEFINHVEEEAFGEVPERCDDIPAGTYWAESGNYFDPNNIHEYARFDFYASASLNESKEVTYTKVTDDYVLNKLQEVFVAFYSIKVNFNNDEAKGTLPYTSDWISLFIDKYDPNNPFRTWGDVKDKYTPYDIETGYLFDGFTYNVDSTPIKVTDDTPLYLLKGKHLHANYVLDTKDFFNDSWEVFNIEMSKTKKEIIEGRYGSLYHASTFRAPDRLINQTEKKPDSFVGLRRTVQYHQTKLIVRIINEELVGDDSDDNKHFMFTFEIITFAKVYNEFAYDINESNIYSACSARKILNINYYSNLPEAVQDNIIDHTSKTKRLAKDDSIKSEETIDKIYLLSASELGLRTDDKEGDVLDFYDSEIDIPHKYERFTDERESPVEVFTRSTDLTNSDTNKIYCISSNYDEGKLEEEYVHYLTSLGGAFDYMSYKG